MRYSLGVPVIQIGNDRILLFFCQRGVFRPILETAFDEIYLLLPETAVNRRQIHRTVGRRRHLEGAALYPRMNRRATNNRIVEHKCQPTADGFLRMVGPISLFAGLIRPVMTYRPKASESRRSSLKSRTVATGSKAMLSMSSDAARYQPFSR